MTDPEIHRQPNLDAYVIGSLQIKLLNIMCMQIICYYGLAVCNQNKIDL